MARSWQRLKRTQALQGRSGALSREHFQDVCQGHSQDVYPLTVGAWGSSLDSSSLVRQIGKGNSLGENALTIHVSFGFWVHLLQWGHSPIPTFWTEFMERQTLPSLEQAGPAEKMEQDSRFFKPGRLNGFWFLLSVKHFFTPGYCSHAIQGFMHSPWMRLPVPGDAVCIARMVFGWKGFCNQPWTLTHFLSILLWPSKKWRQLGFLSTFQGCETKAIIHSKAFCIHLKKKKTTQSLLVPCTIITVTRMIKSLTPNGCPTIHFLSP